MNKLAVSADTKGTTFSDLVREAFIYPIRSVLIIDDQYPTWEQIFSAEGYNPDDNTGRWTPKAKILEVIRQFRHVSPALTVDIHDGKHNDEIASYLHQSDLLVLDYQLEKQEPHGGRASDIIKDLLNNKHFNLVVVHTAIGDLVEPFNKILMSLLEPVGVKKRYIDKGLKIVETFEDSAENDYEDAAATIQDSVTVGGYLAFRSAALEGMDTSTFIDSSDEMTTFRAISEKAKWDNDCRTNVFQWAISTHDQKLAKSELSPKDLRWNAPKEHTQTWIRTSGGFIAFADKKNTDLLSVLQSALEEWKPSPSRLMSSRIRAEISRQGAAAEHNALSDKHAYWQYYQELRKKPLDGSPPAVKNHRKTLLQAHTSRHAERLLDLIGDTAVEFGLKILETDPAETNDSQKGFADHYNINDSVEAERNKALNHYNAYISSKPVSGWHLQPGHIFKADNELWVCVSPACDMVPMQKTSSAVRGSKNASIKPFMAVKLTPHPDFKKGEVNSNTLVFVNEKSNGKSLVKTYSVYPNKGESGSPVWRLFMAEGFGRIEINKDGLADVRLSYLCGLDSEGMTIRNCNSLVVGQLRYEYALNLIQKLGVEFTRIGLDFSPPAN